MFTNSVGIHSAIKVNIEMQSSNASSIMISFFQLVLHSSHKIFVTDFFSSKLLLLTMMEKSSSVQCSRMLLIIISDAIESQFINQQVICMSSFKIKNYNKKNVVKKV